MERSAQMATPYRCTVTIDGTKFGAVTTSVQFSTEKDRSGTPQMGSLGTLIRVWADFHDDQNVPFSTIKKLFDMANIVTLEKIKPMKIEFWKDDARQDALCTYSFNGWIRRFETTNPIDVAIDDDGGSAQFMSIAPQLNHLLILDLEPAMNQKNYKEIKMSN
jgi:hypothetical protein